jgi:beta-glucanase (GH16 family)
MSKYVDSRVRRRAQLLAAALVFALLPVQLAGNLGARSPSASAAPVAVEAAPTCGGVDVPRPGGGSWTCTFADEFDGSGVDPERWQVIKSSTSGFHSGSECFVDSPETVAVSGGTLQLSVRKAEALFVCRAEKGLSGWLSRHHAGMITTFERFTQAYGRFEFRAKFPSFKTRGFQSALWLYPEKKTYGPWPASGEIDVAEFYTRYPDRVIPVAHYAGSRMDPDHTNRDCLVDRPDEFHTYLLEWDTDVLRVSFDGVPCLVDDWRPWGMTKPAPFDKPFHISLTQALGIGLNSPVHYGANAAIDATMEIDYVRVWK